MDDWAGIRCVGGGWEYSFQEWHGSDEVSRLEARSDTRVREVLSSAFMCRRLGLLMDGQGLEHIVSDCSEERGSIGSWW